MLFSDLQDITHGHAAIHQDREVARFSTDTRTLSGSPNEVFVAARGKRDGHDFIANAIEKGVKNFIVEKLVKFDGCNVLQVENAINAFQEIARHHRRQFDIPIIGITGSNGKTTVKEWLSTILSEQYYVVKNPKSFNSQVGVPIALLEIRGNHEIGVFEAGISQKSEMERLQSIMAPTIGIFTTLGEAHNEGFSNHEEKLLEKLRLFVDCEKVICRSDAPYSPLVLQKLGDKCQTWSLDNTGDYQVQWGDGITVNDQHFDLSFTSKTDLENVTHAIVLALHLEVPASRIQSGLDLIRPIPMRLELKKGINGCYILDDTYNNDLAGVKVALDYLESHRQNEKRTLILSDILQSGQKDNELYQSVASLLKERQVTRLIGVGPNISSCRNLFDSKSLFFKSTDELLADLPVFENEMIVIKGARDFALERVVKALEERSHGTILEVNFEALQHNLNQYRNLLDPHTRLMVMVKANAYGSGILEVANFLQHQRVDQLGVAYVDEAIQLRKNGITIPIMIMNPYIESYADFERYNLQAEIFSLKHLDRMLKDTDQPPSIQIKIDTGMHRLGFSKENLPALIEKLKAHPELQVAGIFTHFSSSDNEEEDDFTREQAGIFDSAYAVLADALGYSPVKHACNSPGMVRWPAYHFDMVRLGIGLHGFDPTGQLALRPTSKLKSTISQIQELKKGDTVGYSRKGVIERNSRIAVIPIGYEDGYLRVFGNGVGHMLINGVLCPTIGNICMDMTMVDVTKVDANEGDEVVIFGRKPAIHDLAEWANTIPYEILTNVSSRVKRVFVSE